jgi:hypothetical protein
VYFNVNVLFVGYARFAYVPHGCRLCAAKNGSRWTEWKFHGDHGDALKLFEQTVVAVKYKHVLADSGDLLL